MQSQMLCPEAVFTYAVMTKDTSVLYMPSVTFPQYFAWFHFFIFDSILLFNSYYPPPKQTDTHETNAEHLRYGQPAE